MAIKLDNISDWQRVDADTLLSFPGDRTQSRKIVLEVNPGWPVRVSLLLGGEVFHLATLARKESIEFYHVGEARISFASALPGVDEVEAWVYTADGQQTSTVIPDAETFTTIMTRRARDPQLEYMQFQMEQNFMRLQQQVMAQIARQEGANEETGEIEDEPETGNGPDPEDVGGDQGSEATAPETVADAGSQAASAAKAPGGAPKPAPSRSA